MSTSSVSTSDHPPIRAGADVWGGRWLGALHLRPDCPRLRCRAAQVDEAVVVGVGPSGLVSARESATGYLRRGPVCRLCGVSNV